MIGKLISFQEHGDDRGMLVSLENNKEIPFTIKRVYFLFGTKPGVRRGFHAHKKLQQLLVCVSGQCSILLDNGVDKEIVNLSKPTVGLFLNNDVWREMFDFSDDAVLLVLASEVYDESDYIRDYEQFLEYVKTRRKNK